MPSQQHRRPERVPRFFPPAGKLSASPQKLRAGGEVKNVLNNVNVTCNQECHEGIREPGNNLGGPPGPGGDDLTLTCTHLVIFAKIRCKVSKVSSWK